MALGIDEEPELAAEDAGDDDDRLEVELLVADDTLELIGVLLPTGHGAMRGASSGPLVIGLQPGRASMMPRDTSSITDGC